MKAKTSNFFFFSGSGSVNLDVLTKIKMFLDEIPISVERSKVVKVLVDPIIFQLMISLNLGINMVDMSKFEAMVLFL